MCGHLLLRRSKCKSPAKCRAFTSLVNQVRLDGLDVGGLFAFRAIYDIKAHTLVLSQCAKALGVNLREVREYVVSALIWSDKAKTFGVVEPLNGTSCQFVHSSKRAVKIKGTKFKGNGD